MDSRKFCSSNPTMMAKREERKDDSASPIHRIRKRRSFDFFFTFATDVVLTMMTTMTMIAILSSQHLTVNGFMGIDCNIEMHRSSSLSLSPPPLWCVLRNDNTKTFCTENRRNCHHIHHVLNLKDFNRRIRSSNLFLSRNVDRDIDSDEGGHQDSAKMTTSFLLPIFPLRKRVRFPSDQLTLNLYEPRYIAMCDYILQRPDTTSEDATDDPRSNHRLFGAIYTASKPQIVPQSSGPIVPVLSKGDIGTLCVIFDHLERTSRTGTQQYGNDGRKIRLNAVGVCRFRIEEVVQDGTAGFGDGKDDLLGPFILVRASIVHDSYDTVDRNDLLGRSFDLLERLDGRLATERQLGLSSARQENRRDEVVETAEEYVDWICGLGRSVVSHTGKMERDELFGGDWEDLYKAEIISFLVASTWINNSNNGRNTSGSFVGKQQQQLTVSSTEMIQLLKSISTKDRIEYLETKQSFQ